MKSETPVVTPQPKSGCRKPTSVREWLRLYAVIGPLMFVTLMGLNAVPPLLLHREPLNSWFFAIFQALFTPLGFLGLAIYQERRILRHRPRRQMGSDPTIEILNKLNGKVVATVADESLRKAVFAGMDLRATSLWGEGLEGADLSGTNLSGACLRGAILDGANLSRANLRGASLLGASLHNADLSGADLREAVFHPADLKGAFYDATTCWGPNDAPKKRFCHLKDGRVDLPIPSRPQAANCLTLPRSSALDEEGIKQTRITTQGAGLKS